MPRAKKADREAAASAAVKQSTSLNAVYTANQGRGAKLKKTFEIPFDILVIDDDRNFRERLDEDQVNGFCHSYLTGKPVPAVVIRMVDGSPELIAGFTRAAGFAKAQKQKPELTLIECKEFKGTNAQALHLMYTENEGKPFTFLEKAELMAAANKEGLSPEQIGKEWGVSRTDVLNKLCLAEAPDEIKAMVRDEQVSATTAVEYISKHGADAYDKLVYDLNRASKAGRAKVTAKAGKGTSPFSAAKARNSLELLSHGLEYERIAPKLDSMKGDVEFKLTLSVELAKELIEYVEEYIDHKGD